MSITNNPVLEPLVRELSRAVDSYTALHNSYTLRKMSSGEMPSNMAHIARLRSVGSSVDMAEFTGAMQELCDVFAENDPGFWARLFDTLSKNGEFMKWVLIRAEIAAEDLSEATPVQNVSAEDLRVLSGKAHDLFRALSLSATAFGLGENLPSLPFVTEVKKGAKRSDGSVSYTLNIPEAPRKKSEKDVKKSRMVLVQQEGSSYRIVEGDSLVAQCRNVDSELVPSLVFSAMEAAGCKARAHEDTSPPEYFRVETRNAVFSLGILMVPKV